MRPPIHRMRKADMIWLNNHTCKHGMTYLAHYACYHTEHPEGGPIDEVIGFLDIETTSLNASFGYILSYCIKLLDGDILEYCITPRQIRSSQFDKPLMKQFVKDMKKFDRFVVHWGKDNRFDIPFLRTRALIHDIPFPEWQEYYVTDTWDILKRKFKFHNNRLQTPCDILGIESKGHRLNPEIWQTAQAGKQASLDYILEHNREDVRSTEELWKRIHKFVFPSRVSF